MNEIRCGQVKEIVQRTHNVKSFRLAVENPVEFRAGQFLYVILGSPEDKHLSRYLSISSSPTEGYVEFTKKLTNSEFSKRLEQLKIGDKLWVKYPLGDFTLREGYKKVTFLSGGIGITPIRSICKYVYDNKKEIDIVLIYGNQTQKDVVFKEDFDEMAKNYPELKVVYVFNEAPSTWQGWRGYITGKVIKAEVPDYIERKFYICGPPGMVESSKRLLTEELSVSGENVITENFVGY